MNTAIQTDQTVETYLYREPIEYFLSRQQSPSAFDQNASRPQNLMGYTWSRLQLGAQHATTYAFVVTLDAYSLCSLWVIRK